MADGAIDEILRDGARGLNDDEKARYKRKVEMPLSRRLDIEEVLYEDAIKDGFINRLCEVDVLRNPIAHALRLTYENPALGFSVRDYDPKSGGNNDEVFSTEQSLILFNQPPDIRLRIRVGTGASAVDKSVYLPLGFVQQRLTIRRDMNRPLPIFCNGNRQKELGEYMARQTLVRVATESTSFLKWAKTLAHHLARDYDAIAALQRDEELGMDGAPDSFYQTIYNDAIAKTTPEPIRMPREAPRLYQISPTFPPLQRRLLSYLDMKDVPAENIEKLRASRHYPHANVRKEIEDTKKLTEQPITKKFDDIPSLTTTLVRRERYVPPVGTDAMDVDAEEEFW